LPEWVRRVALEGAGDRVFDVSWEFGEDKREGDGAHQFRSTWDGFLRLVESEAQRRATHKNADAWTAPLVDAPCGECDGSGLGPDARGVTIGGVPMEARTLPELLSLPLGQASEFLRRTTSEDALALAAIESLAPEITSRLLDLESLGLGHLPLGRQIDSLSSGERQRVRLAAVLRAELSGATVVLDEPSAGLQAGEIAVLISSLRGLCEAGNTVVVVEHDRSVLRAADHLIELGPGAGPDGGRIVAEGSPDEVLSIDGSPAIRSGVASSLVASALAETFRLRGVDAGPLSNLDLELPTSGLVTIVGPSGSGKSTLLYDVIEASFDQRMPKGCDRIEPAGILSRFQSVHGRRPAVRAGSVLTALGLMTPFQRLYHSADEGGELPLAAFSFHSPKGRCPACGGSGRERVAMDFMSDLDLPCPVCDGKRYRPEVLTVRWNGLDPSEFLEQPASLLEPSLPESSTALRAGIGALRRAGLGHLALGRDVRSLSGGEVQRLGLAQSLMDQTSPALHLFDEPGAGQHPADLERLALALRELCQRGNLVVIADHRQALVGASDHVLRLGDVE
ncbi:MAG: hypothetical protein KDA27_25335, partial [Candidatus Eisenbacteria bacterium]|nr:hypothetical protein [Candidatus Eisenbacteria bacterium]